MDVTPIVTFLADVQTVLMIIGIALIPVSLLLALLSKLAPWLPIPNLGIIMIFAVGVGMVVLPPLAQSILQRAV